MREVLIFLFPLALALDPTETFPSCLGSSQTWQQDSIYDLAVNVPTPEACQEICVSSSSCAGITWLNEDAALYPQTCYMFSNISGPTVPCENCVSGPPKCLCTKAGECEILEDNLLDIMSGVGSVDECGKLCNSSSSCNFYTFLGEGNHFRHTCYLYKSCSIFVTDCVDCTTGLSHCDICDFEDTQQDGSCVRTECGEGWTNFETSCYKILNNNNQHYNHIDTCRAECNAQGGNLASIHSEEENTFIYNLLRPGKTDFADQETWLGAKYNDRGNVGIYHWEDGSAWDYQNWAPDQGDCASYDVCCVFMGFEDYHPEKWSDGVCDYTASKDFDCVCKKSET